MTEIKTLIVEGKGIERDLSKKKLLNENAAKLPKEGKFKCDNCHNYKAMLDSSMGRVCEPYVPNVYVYECLWFETHLNSMK